MSDEIQLINGTCFVIAPIGELGSQTRSRSDKVLRHIIVPAAAECGYEVVRSDRESQPGMIASQVINHLIEDELVIADLTDHNPNVFYELAIRHVVRRPIVQMIEVGQRLPFDVIQSRTIFVDHTDLDSAAECREQLVRQIRAAEKDPTDVDNPITQAVKLKAMDQSADPEEKRDAQILTMLKELTVRVDRLAEKNGEGRFVREHRSWSHRELVTAQDVQGCLNKFEEFRNLDNRQRITVKNDCAKRIREIGPLSRNEVAQILESYLENLGISILAAELTDHLDQDGVEEKA